MSKVLGWILAVVGPAIVIYVLSLFLFNLGMEVYHKNLEALTVGFVVIWFIWLIGYGVRKYFPMVLFIVLRHRWMSVVLASLALGYVAPYGWWFLGVLAIATVTLIFEIISELMGIDFDKMELDENGELVGVHMFHGAQWTLGTKAFGYAVMIVTMSTIGIAPFYFLGQYFRA